MPDRSWITVSFRTALFFHYHLPLRRHISDVGSKVHGEKSYFSKVSNCIRRKFQGRYRIQGRKDSGSGSASKNLSIFNPKKLFLSSQKYNPGCSSRIRILIFFIHPWSWIQGVKKGPGSRIRNTCTFYCRSWTCLNGRRRAWCCPPSHWSPPPPRRFSPPSQTWTPWCLNPPELLIKAIDSI